MDLGDDDLAEVDARVTLSSLPAGSASGSSQKASTATSGFAPTWDRDALYGRFIVAART